MPALQARQIEHSSSRVHSQKHPSPLHSPGRRQLSWGNVNFVLVSSWHLALYELIRRKRHQELRGTGRESGRRISHSSSCSSYTGWSHASSWTTLLPCTDSPMRPCEENALIKERGYCFLAGTFWARGRWASFLGAIAPNPGPGCIHPARNLILFFFRIRCRHRRHGQLRLVGGPMTPNWSRNRHGSCFLFPVSFSLLAQDPWQLGAPQDHVWFSECIVPNNDRTYKHFRQFEKHRILIQMWFQSNMVLSFVLCWRAAVYSKEC